MTAPEPTHPADEHTGTVALDLDAIEARANAATEWNGPIGGPATDVARKDVPALVAYARRKSALAADSHARAESAEAEVATLRANWRHVTKSLGYGDGVTEPQIGHVEFVAECERQFSEASEWRESQRWRDECHDAGHPDDEDCYEHDPALVLLTLRAKVAAAEALADQWADRKRSDGMSGNAWIGITLAGVAADLRAALATTGEGQ